MRQDQVSLQLHCLIWRNPGVCELSKSGIDPINTNLASRCPPYGGGGQFHLCAALSIQFNRAMRPIKSLQLLQR
jgi:hypothetical protein